MRAHMRNNNGDQTTREENLYMADRPRMLTRDLFAIANLLLKMSGPSCKLILGKFLRPKSVKNETFTSYLF